MVETISLRGDPKISVTWINVQVSRVDYKRGGYCTFRFLHSQFREPWLADFDVFFGSSILRYLCIRAESKSGPRSHLLAAHLICVNAWVARRNTHKEKLKSKDSCSLDVPPVKLVIRSNLFFISALIHMFAFMYQERYSALFLSSIPNYSNATSDSGTAVMTDC